MVSRLVCVYTSGENPYIRYKEEIHNLDPKIVFFHDVVSNREATLLKSAATSQVMLDSAVVTLFLFKVSWAL